MSNPYVTLGVAPTAQDEDIRQAYLAAIRTCPPERDRGRFETVRAAYEAIAHEDRRLRHALFDLTPPDAQDALVLLRSTWQPAPPCERSLRSVLQPPGRP